MHQARDIHEAGRESRGGSPDQRLRIGGNAFTGHRKEIRVRGALYQDGARIGSFRGERDSMGGAFAGFAGSCSVLGRTVKALGSDIAEWLQKPSEGASLGDLE